MFKCLLKQCLIWQKQKTKRKCGKYEKNSLSICSISDNNFTQIYQNQQARLKSYFKMCFCCSKLLFNLFLVHKKSKQQISRITIPSLQCFCGVVLPRLLTFVGHLTRFSKCHTSVIPHMHILLTGGLCRNLSWKCSPTFLTRKFNYSYTLVNKVNKTHYIKSRWRGRGRDIQNKENTCDGVTPFQDGPFFLPSKSVERLREYFH